MEEWKVYKITKVSIWEVSNFGNVKRNGILVNLLKYEHQKYYFIGGFYLHKAVTELFIPNPNNYPHIDHIDTNKHNNHYTNLRWCTQKMNSNNPLTRKHNSEAQKGHITWMKGKNHTDESKKKCSDANIDARWMNDGINNHYVLKENIDECLNLGYVFGRLNGKFRWMNKDGEYEQVKLNDVDKYLELGYNFGRK